MNSLDRIEGQPAHFETRVQPVNDNKVFASHQIQNNILFIKLVIQWFKDGQPLQNSNRLAFTHDFGFVALDIAHTAAHDAGTYTVKAINEQGEAQVDGQLTVEPVS